MNSEHAWVLENIETFTAGGLDADERERLEIHVANCPPCAGALADARMLDQTMTDLFAEAQPPSALEDRMLQALRAGARRRKIPVWRFLVPAAVVALGVVGTTVSQLINDSQNLRMAVSNKLKQLPAGGAMKGMSRIETEPQDRYRYEAESLKDSLASVETKQKVGQGLGVGDELGDLGAVLPGGGQPSRGEQKYRDGTYNRSSGQNGETGPDDKNKVAGVDRQASIVGGGFLFGKNAPSTVRPLSELTDEAVDEAHRINSYGYYPPSRGLVQKGTGRTPAAAALPPSVSLPAAATQLGIHVRNAVTVSPDSTKLASKVAPTGPVTYFTDLDRVTVADSDIKVTPGVVGYQGITSLGVGSPRPTDAKPAGREMIEAVGGANPLVNAFKERLREEGRQRPTDPRPAKPDLADQVARADKPAEAEGKPPAPEAPAPAAARKIIIRTGDIDFEITSFDSAAATITKLANSTAGAFVATVNSEKLPNGKVRGSMVVRMPPEQLDGFVLDLRKELGKSGELKGLKIGSQDITKQYTDLESRLKAARTMEERLLLIIKNGKGEIKDLLATEKELGNWRTQIESFEGELRYFANQVALSTLTITLYEKEIKAPYGLVSTERVQMGVEVEEVDKALQQALKSISEVKGRVTKSELKQHAAGQFNALLHFEVSPDASGPMRDRLRQLGTVTRLDVDRVQQTEGGTGTPTHDAPIKQNDAQFQVSLYNIANVQPRETVVLGLACTDTETVYQTLLSKIRKTAGARVVTSNLNRQKNDQTTGTLNFEVKADEAAGMLTELKNAGEVLQLQFTENPDTQTVTGAKRGFNVQLNGMGLITPRETTVLQLAARDVPKAVGELREAISRLKGRVLNAQLKEEDRQNITAQFDFDLRRADLAQLDTTLGQLGDVISRNVVRAPEGDNVLDSRVRFQVALLAQSRIPPRQTTTLGMEVTDVDGTAAALTEMALKEQGRVAGSNVVHERNGQITARLTYDVPLASATSLVQRIKTAGTVRIQKSDQNEQVPEGPLAIGRIDVTLSNQELIVPTDGGFWTQIRKGLSTSIFALSWSLTVVVIGVCFVLPWGLIGYGGYRVWSRFRPKPVVPTSPVPTP
jgi:hypothetical protein